ncbi:MAG: aminopeptidase P family protein [Deltaproteobacteria bacterium]|nr:aminopeptidase P family protein [Deltaproteobacteria bacterium]
MSVAKLLIADSETNADLLWATDFFVPDPIIYFEWRGKKFLVASDLEYSRAKKEAAVDKVLSLSAIGSLDRVFKKFRIKNLLVPLYMGVGTVNQLKKKGYKITIKEGPFFEGRAIKTQEEKRKITASLRATEQAIEKARDFLRSCRIRKNRIVHDGTIVTSELLRKIIDTNLFENGFIPKQTIVASGRQAADPHCTGTGPLKPNEPIVMDVFPRSQKTGYYGDITRTVIKGKASPAVKAMYDAVKASQEAAFPLIRHGVEAAKVHQAVCDVLDKRGFPTKTVNGQPQGYIHSTGHGLGLEIHEPPRISRLSEKLKKGNVVTVEPGLYYPDRGGIRIEDVVFVTRNGCEKLTHLHRELEIP